MACSVGSCGDGGDGGVSSVDEDLYLGADITNSLHVSGGLAPLPCAWSWRRCRALRRRCRRHRH
eukprot:583501-Pyramimonas_sp.AAC.1